LHTGVDLAASGGTAIYAAQSGVVEVSTTNGGGFGYYIKIQHDNGLETMYAHCSKLLVKEGETVQRGQKIAEVGKTGSATGCHLHFEVIKNGQYVQPLNYISDTRH
jgi:murein DD-endopeptidase MepM/ murein hydrolase activator NlpD